MDPNVAAALVAAGAAALSVVVSIVFGVLSSRSASRSALAAEEAQRLAARQLEASVEATEQALQPYVWADLRARSDGGFLVLHLGNSGPTVATGVRVQFAPPLETVTTENRRTAIAATAATLAQGLKSLAPGRTIEWTLGMTHEIVPEQGTAPSVLVTIDADGPFGALPTLQYNIDLEQVKYSSSRGEGLGLIEKAIRSVGTETRELHRVVGRMTTSG
jgi:hypothetical protein